MTERLSQLMHDEADTLAIPQPQTAATLARGRRARTRDRVLVGSAAVATTAVLVGAALVATNGADDPTTGRGLDPATAAYLDAGAFATGSTIHLPGGRDVTVEEKVKVLYYTSAGVLARTGRTPWTDDPGPSHYTLVRPDGALSTLDLDLGDRVPATDPDQPVMVYADSAGGTDRWDVVVLDVDTGAELARVRVDGSFTWGGWEAPPVELDGDLVYVGLDDTTVAVDWRASTVIGTDLDAPAGPSVAGGRVVQADHDEVRVVDLSTGAAIYTTPNERYPYIDLSPDGRYAKVVHQDEMEGASFEVVDLDTGEVATVEGAAWDFGWTPTGNLLRVDLEAGIVTTCDPVDGDCAGADITGSTQGELKLAGLAYES